jgi:hypothetical protein
MGTREVNEHDEEVRTATAQARLFNNSPQFKLRTTRLSPFWEIPCTSTRDTRSGHVRRVVLSDPRSRFVTSVTRPSPRLVLFRNENTMRRPADAAPQQKPNHHPHPLSRVSDPPIHSTGPEFSQTSWSTENGAFVAKLDPTAQYGSTLHVLWPAMLMTFPFRRD